MYIYDLYQYDLAALSSSIAALRHLSRCRRKDLWDEGVKLRLASGMMREIRR